MVWKITVGLILVAGFQIHTKVVFGDERYRCPSALTRNAYLRTFGEKCYRFVLDEVYWTTARDRCTQVPTGHLIEVRSQALQTWVLNSFNELGWPYNGIWIGAHDRDDEMSWKWVSGDAITWSNWGSGQPSCGIFLCIEDCGQIRRDDGGRWHDYHCSSYPYTYSYICEYDMSPPTTTTSTTTETMTTAMNTTIKTTTLPTTTTTRPTTTTTRPTTTTTVYVPTTTTTTPPTTTTTTSTTTTTPTTTTTTPSTMSPTTVIMTPTTTTSENIPVVLSQRSTITGGATAGIVTAGIIGGIVLLLFLGVCFYRRRKKENKDELAVHFDNLTYAIRSLLSSQSRLSTHENLNNQTPTANQNEYAYAGDCNGATRTVSNNNVKTISKEPNHYSEIDEQKLNVQLPKYDNSFGYEKCNIAKSKLGQMDSSQYLDACATSKGTHDTLRGEEVICNAMNEQLESSGKNHYDECKDVGDQVNPYANPYETMRDGIPRTADSAESQPQMSDSQTGVYQEMLRPTNMAELFENIDGNLDLSKAPSGYNNNVYSSNA